MLSSIIRPSKNIIHPRATIARPRVAFHHLRDILVRNPPPSLLFHSARARTYHATAPLALQPQVRAISLWSIPKLALRTVRIPFIVAGTTITTASIASNKLQGNFLIIDIIIA